MPTRPLTMGQLVEAVALYKELGDYAACGRKIDLSKDAFRHRIRQADAIGLRDKAPVDNESEFKTHCIIPDVQAKAGVPLDHLKWAGEYIAEKRPDVIICIGDFADMESLSSYDKGKRNGENKRYKYDIEAAHKAMELLMTPIVKAEGYKPRLIMTLGNHEQRIIRASNDSPELYETLKMSDLGYEAWGFEVYPFLEVVTIDGVEYSHYFTTGAMGRPASSASAMMKARQRSCTMGHSQIYDTYIHPSTQQRALMCGTFYQHNENYLTPQGNNYRRSIVFKHQVQDGKYDLMEISLDYLRRRYK